MKKIKKILTFGLAGVVALSGGVMLAGCQNNNSTTPSQQEQGTVDAETQIKIENSKTILNKVIAEYDRISHLDTSSSIVKVENASTSIFNEYEINVNTECTQPTTLAEMYEHFGILGEDDDDMSLTLKVFLEVLKMQGFKFNTMYTFSTTAKMSISYHSNYLSLIILNNFEGVSEITNVKIYYDSNNNILSCEYIGMKDNVVDSYDKEVFATNSNRGYDYVLSIGKDETRSSVIILSEISGYRYWNQNLTSGITYNEVNSKLSNLTAFGIQCPENETIMLDDATIDSITNLLG